VIRSNGLLQRDYVYVEDAVAAFLAIGEKLEQPEVNGQLFRIATGTGTTTLDIVKHLVRIAGTPHLEPTILNQKSEERVDTIYNPEFEQSVLGWKSRYSLEQGLSRTWQTYAKFFEKQGV
jgi:CDP-glucose 4,6-dehydratase